RHARPRQDGWPRWGHGWPRWGHGWPRWGHGWPRWGHGWPRWGHGRPRWWHGRPWRWHGWPWRWHGWIGRRYGPSRCLRDVAERRTYSESNGPCRRTEAKPGGYGPGTTDFRNDRTPCAGSHGTPRRTGW